MRALFIAVLVMLSVCPAFGVDLVVYYHERVPYAHSAGGGEVQGLTASAARDALKRAGIPFRWEIVPAKRQVQIIAENREQACMLGWYSTPERLQSGKLSRPLYQDLPLVVFARADNANVPRGDVPVSDLIRNKKLMMLVKEAYSYGEYVDELLATYSPERELTVVENDTMLRMILRARADYLFMAKEEARELLSGLTPAEAQQLRLIHPPDAPAGSTRHLWCTLQLSDKTMKAINAAIKPIKLKHAAAPAGLRPAGPKP